MGYCFWENHFMHINSFGERGSMCGERGWLSQDYSQWYIPSKHLLVQSNNRTYRKRCEIFLKLTVMTPEWLKWRHSGVFVVKFEHILLLFFSTFPIVNCEQVNLCSVVTSGLFCFRFGCFFICIGMVSYSKVC